MLPSGSALLLPRAATPATLVCRALANARPGRRLLSRNGLQRPNVAVLGATGAVGREFLSSLRSRNFPLNHLRLLASSRSAGSTMRFGDQELKVEAVGPNSFEGIDIAFFSAGGGRSKEWAPVAVKSGAIVIDNSSAFRMDPNVPLVVPEVNPQAVKQHQGIIANPNCSTIIMNVAVWPLHQRVGVERCVVATYQAASGAGAAAMAELEQQARDWTNDQPLKTDIFKRQYLWNLFSHNSAIDMQNGYNEEELKMVKETRKIFGDEKIRVTATCVRVPVLRAHSEAINLTFRYRDQALWIVKVLWFLVLSFPDSYFVLLLFPFFS